MNITALDIGTYSIKVIVGSPGTRPKLNEVIEVLNPSGLVVPNDEKSQLELLKTLEAVFNDYKLPVNDVRFALPESVVSTKVIEIPPLSDAELASAIDWQAEQNLPIPLDDLSLEYEVLFRPKKGSNKSMRVLLVGVRKSLLEKYVVLFENLGVEPTLMEPQMLALIRSLQFQPEDEETVVVDWGAAGVSIAAMSGVELAFVTYKLGGGILLTKAIEKSLGLDSKQAEDYKRSFGLDEAQFEGRLKQALLPVVMEVVSQLKRSLQFYNTSHPQKTIKRLVLAGGTANLVGLIPLLTSELGIEVLLISPWNVVKAKDVDLTQVNPVVMGVVTGLMMKRL